MLAVGSIPSSRRRPESRGGGPVRSYNRAFTYPCRGGGGVCARPPWAAAPSAVSTAAAGTPVDAIAVCLLSKPNREHLPPRGEREQANLPPTTVRETRPIVNKVSRSRPAEAGGRTSRASPFATGESEASVGMPTTAPTGIRQDSGSGNANSSRTLLTVCVGFIVVIVLQTLQS